MLNNQNNMIIDKYFVLAILSLIFLSCEFNQDIEINKKVSNHRKDTSSLHINDSLNFAYKSIYNKKDQSLSLKFYKFEDTKWIFDYRVDSIFSQIGHDSLEIMDFNFDNIFDLRMYSYSGARGANSYYVILLKDTETNQFKLFEFKKLPPNLVPNIKTKKLEAMIFYNYKVINEKYIIENVSLIKLSSIETPINTRLEEV